MAKKIQMWAKYGPRLANTDEISAEEVVEQLVQSTSQTRGSVLSVLAELDDVIIQGLKSGRIVKLPNGTSYRPIGKKDGSIKVQSRLTSRIGKQVNAAPRVKWINAQNIGKTEAEMIAFWNEQHPDDLIEP